MRGVKGESGGYASASTAVPRANGSMAWVELDGEVVIYDAETSSLHLLNPAAASVWLCCDGTSSVDQIITDLTDAYQADQGQIAADVTELIDQFAAKGLLEGTSLDRA